MDISYDYEDLLRILNKRKVKYIVVGAYAVIYYSEPRFTKDLDIWVKQEPKNVSRLYFALKEFGAPLRNIHPSDFLEKNMIYQIGVAPVRVDIILDIADISFDVAWENRVKSRYSNIPINILGLKELIKSKKKTGRSQDRLDLEKLRKV